MKKGILAGLIVLWLALFAGTAAVMVTSDRKGPEIAVPSGADVTYEEGSDTALLLEGVTATDDRDGDVTDSVVIENIFPNDDRTGASVIYAAKDSHNNVTKVTRRVNYKAAGDVTAPEENTEAEGSDAAPAENAEAEGSDAAPAAEEAQQNDTEGVKNETNAKMEIEALPSESPRMYLNTYETTVKAGSELDKISYIKEITDDADSQETLFTDIQVDGEVDTATPGDYTLTYHVTDSNGNQSNMAVLTVHVQ
ncbi:MULTISPECIES: immunoglobulin-like domain-containing protein [Lachnospiraceae]|uniref:immunoglobulin-like domain-containing protein n=1 Tax=Lachnospiraceae TaxID=186803 RepID=UPI000E49BB94|nr:MULTISPECIES: immunoglobulin-like domain-containing protein [Lachnospiraceae]MCB5525504.1 DUF5011 domain-containing protein [Fusicatenibacter saccharivorans]MCB5670629.1 DUF5011 domain-containing protein [Fusicatenibacter saccharivorans]MCB5690113.1 DUF5011 domain-containing protein [Fusicatenibacter saccharivorans]MCB5693782.1 DUF5011 domain-containing protein [Fusicatenibacter saccharivorans]MCC2729385.1 DUF5011 domain-containing protein [Fusicatenibacter saccharivorans]